MIAAPWRDPEARARAIQLRDRVVHSTGARYGVILGAAMFVAGVLDYTVSVVTGRWLAPVEFGVFIAVTALLQVLLSLATAMRMVVAFYTATLGVEQDAPARIGAFVRGAAGWCARWGLVGMATAVAFSPPLARALHLPSAWPLWAASLMVLMLFLREPMLGALQGAQLFGGLAILQVSQATLRVVLAAALILAGAGAVGAIVAQPLAAVGAVALGLWWLRPYLRQRGREAGRRVSWSYSLATVLGLALFGIMTNLDALFVKAAFSPAVAGQYGTVVTFEKISLFLPWAISFVLFPKVAQRTATGRDARRILLLALAAAMAPGLALSAAYFLFSGAIVRAVFTDAYADPGVVLALASLAATLYAGVNIWLNYALSTRRNRFVWVLLGVVLWQAVGMFALGRESLVTMALTMVSAGLLGNLGGFLATWGPARAPPARAVAAPSGVECGVRR
jgi:O-antigen/teichoic acid export membrane protein